MSERELWQQAPWPGDLEVLVAQCTYRKHEGWRVHLDPNQDRDYVDGRIVGRGTTLVITTCGFDAYNPERGTTYRVHHYFIVPAATYNRDAWQRWLFDQFAKVELHETMENFVIDGARPFAPLHGPGCDPYTVHQASTDEQRRTRFTGEVLT
jgi:hypothetical protein